ncbi:hypothetical protein Vafri_2826 [Volvox africanus]|uniref:Uncharacterized protein n=1 Tax=Volvox africanus TaxID=51714 RepID=A0A8J4ARX1_9CHLO|nr:hypothetical protein Vafri_2826 [Volvox africanus]
MAALEGKDSSPHPLGGGAAEAQGDASRSASSLRFDCKPAGYPPACTNSLEPPATTSITLLASSALPCHLPARKEGPPRPSSALPPPYLPPSASPSPWPPPAAAAPIAPGTRT